MKTIKTIFAALIAVFTLSTAMASEAGSLKVNMETKVNELTTVEISTVALSHYEIEVSDAYGESIYSMETDAPVNALKKRYDFSKLEDGIYWHTVKIDNESTVNKFKVDRGNVEIMEVRKSIDPFFKFEDDLLKMTYLNPQLEDVELFVYNSSDQLLTKVNLGQDFTISKALDFSEKRYGTYDVVIVNGPDMYEYSVSVE